MTNSLYKFRQLSWRERGLLLRSLLLLPLVHAALLALGYARLRGWMERLAPLQPGAEALDEARVAQRAREIARMVEIAARHGFYRAGCLRRSLLVWWLLRKAGMRSSLCFGVRMRQGRLEAHAWVEYENRVVNDSATVREQYQPLFDVLPSIEVEG